MRYTDDRERSAELLRLALPHMSRHAAAVHPVCYAVWYEYVSGRNSALAKRIDSLTAAGGLLDEDATQTLFDEHVVEIDDEAAHRIAESFRQLLAKMEQSTREAGNQTKSFGDSLSHWTRQLDAGAAPDAVTLGALMHSARQMGNAIQELQARLEAGQQEMAFLRAEVDRARDEALLDSLTGLANRRAFERNLARHIANGHTPSCLLITDVDHFKRINDTYGHLFGDQVLRAIAETLRGSVDAGHMAARVGGEEFAILLRDTGTEAASAVAEKIRESVARSRIRRRGESDAMGSVTVSLGLAQWNVGESAEEWFERADRALYAAKSAGRNRVSIS